MNKRNILLLWGIALLQGMVFYAPVATLYRQAAGLGIFHITLIESISLWLTICLEIPWGWAADRIGYRKTMLVCCFLYFVSKLIFWKAEGFGGFLLERTILSIVCAGLSGVDSAMLYLSAGEENSHRILSIYENLGQLGILLAAGIHALWIGDHYRLAAFLTVLSYGAAAALSFGLQEVSPESDREETASCGKLFFVLREQIATPRVLFLLIAVGLLNGSHQTITVFLSQLQYVRAGMTQQEISLAYILVNLLALAGGFSAALRSKTGARAMGTGLFLMAALGCLLLGMFPLPVISVLAVILLRLSFSLLQPLQMDLQNSLIRIRDRATALSVNAVALDGLGIFLNLIFGKLAQENLTGAMLLGAVLCAVGGLLYLRSFSEQ